MTFTYSRQIRRVFACSHRHRAQTYSTINTFILAMVLHPHVLKKAQEEIDRVVGPNRLPDFDDRENLPYIEAIFQEVLR